MRIREENTESWKRESGQGRPIKPFKVRSTNWNRSKTERYSGRKQ